MSDRFYEEGTQGKSTKKPHSSSSGSFGFSDTGDIAFSSSEAMHKQKQNPTKPNKIDITDIKPVKMPVEKPKPNFTVNIPELQDKNSSLSQMKKTAPANKPKPQPSKPQYSQTKYVNTPKSSAGFQEISPEILKQYAQNNSKTVNISSDSIKTAANSANSAQNFNTNTNAATEAQLAAQQRRAKIRAQAQQRAKDKIDKQNSRNKAFIKFCICFIVVLLCTSTLTSMAVDTLNDILVFDSESSFAVAVTIPSGADFDTVYEILCDKGLVDQKLISKMFCLFRGYDEDIYEAGVYYLESSDSIEVMLETIKDASINSSETVTLTFPEGYTIAQIFEKLEYYEVCTAEKLYANLSIVASDYSFYENIPDTYGRYLDVEGYLFPDTYEFYISETPSSVLSKLFNNFEDKWSDEYTQRAEELGMTMDEIVIIASIIQKEAANSSQMADISSVLHNRLEQSSTFPQLQFNSTTDYIIALKEYDLFTDFYYDFYLDTYNTYSVTGLPPGSICNPGISAIEAALYPSDTNYVYFCHDDEGNIYLASTAQEHYSNTQYIL